MNSIGIYSSEYIATSEFLMYSFRGAMALTLTLVDWLIASCLLESERPSHRGQKHFTSLGVRMYQILLSRACRAFQRYCRLLVIHLSGVRYTQVCVALGRRKGLGCSAWTCVSLSHVCRSVYPSIRGVSHIRGWVLDTRPRLRMTMTLTCSHPYVRTCTG